MFCISDRYRFTNRHPVGPTSCRLQHIGPISDSYHFHNLLTWLISLYRTDIRGVVGPICRHSDHLSIYIWYGHADWASRPSDGDVNRAVPCIRVYPLGTLKNHRNSRVDFLYSLPLSLGRPNIIIDVKWQLKPNSIKSKVATRKPPIISCRANYNIYFAILNLLPRNIYRVEIGLSDWHDI